MAERVTLDPAEVASNRTELDITAWLDQSGLDWGDAEISAYMAETHRGERAVDFRVPNRKVSAGLVFGNTRGGTANATARAMIQQKLALIQSEGGWVKRVTNSGGTVYADIVNATLHATSVAGWESREEVDTSAHIELECLPDFYGDEVALSDHTETSAAELIFAETDVDGDYPGRVRVVVDDDQGVDQLGLIWSFRSRHYDASATSAVAYEAEALQPLGAARAVALSGASGGTVVNHGTLSTNWTGVVGTNIGGTTYLTHQGTYRLYARIHSTSGTLVQARFVWDVGDLVNPVENTAFRLPGPSNFYTLDFGELRLDPTVGDHRWQGQIQAKGDVGTESFSVDRVWLAAVDEGFGKLTAPIPTTQGAVDYTYRDEFNQSAGTLNAKVIGGPTAIFSGPRYAGTGADDSSVGTVAWTNPGNVTASDDTRATNALGAAATGHYLKATNFGFAIPTSATINGIIVEVERSAPSYPNVVDNAVRIVKGGTVQSTNKAKSAIWPTTDAFATYGSANDLWGASWAYTDINASTFGVAISPKCTDAFGNTARIDSVRITVYYTPASGDTWATAGGSATDFSVDATNHNLTRTTTSDSADSGRGAVAGATVFTDQAVQVDIKASVANAGLYCGALLRHNSFTEKLRVELYAFGGVFSAVQVNRRSVSAGNGLLAVALSTQKPIVAGVTYTLRAIVTSSGTFYVWVFEQGSTPGLPLIVGQDSSLATGGALASGKSGIYDECSTTPATTRTYDNFSTWVPSHDAVIFAARSCQLTTDGHFRQDPTGVAYGPVSNVIGDLPRLPQSGLEGRDAEVFIKASRGNFADVPDSGIDDISAQAFYRPAWLFTP